MCESPKNMNIKNEIGVEMIESSRQRGRGYNMSSRKRGRGYKMSSRVITQPCIRSTNNIKSPVDLFFYNNMVISAKSDSFDSDFDEIYFPKCGSGLRKTSSDVSRNWCENYGNVQSDLDYDKKLTYSDTIIFGKKQKPPRLSLIQKHNLKDDIERDWNEGNLIYKERAYIEMDF